MSSAPGSSAKEALERRGSAGLSPAKRALLLAQAGFAPAPPTPTIPRADRTGELRLSYGQELLWLIEQSTPGHTYNVPRSVRLRGTLDESALKRAADALVERHETLRTTYHLESAQAVQRVNPAAPATIDHIDLTTLPENAREDATRARVRELARVPFDLARDPQLRVALIRLAADDHVLFLCSHHIASDGWSGGILLRELGALYDAERRGARAELPPLPVQYVDFAEWQRTTLAGERLEQVLGYWRTQLAGAPQELELPMDRPRTAKTGSDGATRGLTFQSVSAEKVRSMAQSLGATPFMVYLAAAYVLLYRYTDETELVVGTPIAGRTLPELEGVVGFFANTLLLRVSLAGEPTFRELVDRVRTASLGRSITRRFLSNRSSLLATRTISR